jgi:predicted HicB family RNase H-like nuclease
MSGGNEMRNMMEYKVYRAKIEYSDADSCFYGKVDGITDLVSFEGGSVDELRKSFIEAVDYYIENCRKSGDEPQIPYKGSFNIRISPDLHKKAAILAAKRDTSLNGFIQMAISEKIDRDSKSSSK